MEEGKVVPCEGVDIGPFEGGEPCAFVFYLEQDHALDQFLYFCSDAFLCRGCLLAGCLGKQVFREGFGVLLLLPVEFFGGLCSVSVKSVSPVFPAPVAFDTAARTGTGTSSTDSNASASYSPPRVSPHPTPRDASGSRHNSPATTKPNKVSLFPSLQGTLEKESK